MLWVASPSPDGRNYLTEIESSGIHRGYKCDPMVAPSSASFSHANNVLIVPQSKNAIFLYSVAMQQPIQKCFTPEKVSATAVSPCGAFAIGGGNDSGCLYTWVIATGELLAITKAHMRAVTSICFNKDGGLVATSSADSTVKVWRLVDLCSLNAAAVSTFSGHTLAVTKCTFFNFSNLVAAVSRDRSCRVFDALTGLQLASIPIEEPGFAVSVAHTDDLLFCGGDRGLLTFIKLYDVAGPVVVKVPSFEDGHKKAITFVASLPRQRVVSCSEEGAVLLWDVAGTKPMVIREVAHVKHGICSAFVVPDVSLKMLQDGLITPPTQERAPVLSKYPCNTIANETRFSLLHHSVLQENTDAKSGSEQLATDCASQQVDVTGSNDGVSKKVAAVEELRLQLASSKYNKKKQKRLREAIEENEREIKAKRSEVERARAEEQKKISAAEVKCRELQALATKMAKALKKMSPFGSATS